MYDTIVVGAGSTGLVAAIHSAVFGLRTLVLEAEEKAGGLATGACGISNYPCLSNEDFRSEAHGENHTSGREEWF